GGSSPARSPSRATPRPSSPDRRPERASAIPRSVARALRHTRSGPLPAGCPPEWTLLLTHGVSHKSRAAAAAKPACEHFAHRASDDRVEDFHHATRSRADAPFALARRAPDEACPGRYVVETLDWEGRAHCFE